MDPIPLDTVVLKSLQVDSFAPYILPLTVESITVKSIEPKPVDPKELLKSIKHSATIPVYFLSSCAFLISSGNKELSK